MANIIVFRQNIKIFEERACLESPNLANKIKFITLLYFIESSKVPSI